MPEDLMAALKASLAAAQADRAYDLGRDECWECAAQDGHAAACSAYVPALPEARADQDVYSATVRDAAGRFWPTLQESIGKLDGYAWHALYEPAVEAIGVAHERHGAMEAAARATELADLFEAMCVATPGAWG